LAISDEGCLNASDAFHTSIKREVCRRYSAQIPSPPPVVERLKSLEEGPGRCENPECLRKSVSAVMRRGPNGKSTLCNACGLFFSRNATLPSRSIAIASTIEMPANDNQNVDVVEDAERGTSQEQEAEEVGVETNVPSVFIRDPLSLSSYELDSISLFGYADRAVQKAMREAAMDVCVAEGFTRIKSEPKPQRAQEEINQLLSNQLPSTSRTVDARSMSPSPISRADDVESFLAKDTHDFAAAPSYGDDMFVQEAWNASHSNTANQLPTINDIGDLDEFDILELESLLY
jgi:hypothetical protein